MHQQLRTLSSSLRRFLAAHLSESRPDWWQQDVLDSLTHNQREIARDRSWAILDDLDLAALLQVLDSRWEMLGPQNGLSFDDRIRLTDAQSIHNRHEHGSTAKDPDPRQAYRDLDCIALLCAAFGAPAEDLAAVELARDGYLSMLLGSPGFPDGEPAKSAPSRGTFAPGAQVCLSARPEVVGVVVEALPGSPEDQLRVFHDGAVHTYYSSQLTAHVSAGGSAIDADSFHAALTATQLTHPSTRFLYSLNSGRIEFEPYQFRPVLKLIQSDRPRLLIADDVGVGKTIEASLILKELQARQDLASVLVICPKPLVAEDKWRLELRRFDEDFVHLDGPTLRHCLDETKLEGAWPLRYRKAILPYSLLDERLLFGSDERGRTRPGLVDLDPPPQFDLVIVDEAHHVRNPGTWSYRNVRQFIDAAEAVVFLSATPIQTSDNDLYTLLNLLRPDLLSNPREFQQMSEPNPHLSAASAAARVGSPGYEAEALAHLDSAIATTWGQGVLRFDPRVRQVRDLLNGGAPVGDADRVRVVRRLDEMNTFSNLISRTRRRDIGEFTTRKPATVEVPFTNDQQQVYDDLVDLCRRIARRQSPGQPVEFLLSTLQRQAASCLNGLGPLVEDILMRRVTAGEISEADGDETEVGSDLLAEFRDDIEQVVEAAGRLGDADAKLEAFRSVVEDKQQLKNNKLLVFSTFRHTLAYLENHLVGSDIRVSVVHGDVRDEERRELRRRFKLPREDPRAIDLMLCSEVGTEGLDYQFCNTLVNYDLPWNPMRVEQRIGRLDRRGQKSETVAIVNLVTPGTVDASIYHRCLYRIGVFQRALGGSEAILGELTREMRSIAENLSLTEAERDNRLRQLADNKLGRIQELERLEEQQSQLFGLAVRASDSSGIEDATSPWLTPAKIAHLVSLYLKELDPARQVLLSEGSLSVLRPTAAMRNRLLADCERVRDSDPTDSRWMRWLKSHDPVRRVTLSAQMAEDDPETEVLNPTHPLVRAAAARMQVVGMPTVSLRTSGAELPPGRYPFGVYGWNRLSVRDDFTLQAIGADAALSPALTRALAGAASSQTPTAMSDSDRATVEHCQYYMWAQARAAHRDDTRIRIGAQLASLRTTHAARTGLLLHQMAQAGEDRIRRMRDGQLRNAERDFASRQERLAQASTRCDLLSEPLVLGVLEVLRP
jgi:ATP-dependent helicase HepA